jgi:hypothetical protein
MIFGCKQKAFLRSERVRFETSQLSVPKSAAQGLLNITLFTPDTKPRKMFALEKFAAGDYSLDQKRLTALGTQFLETALWSITAL